MRAELVLVVASLFAPLACGGAGGARGQRSGAPEVDDLELPLRATAHGPPSEPPAPVPVAASPPASPPGRARASGRRIDLDVKGADLHNLFRLLADVGGVDIVVADDVQGAVTLRLRRVPWDQVLFTVVRSQRLRLERIGDILLVTNPVHSKR